MSISCMAWFYNVVITLFSFVIIGSTEDCFELDILILSKIYMVLLKTAGNFSAANNAWLVEIFMQYPWRWKDKNARISIVTNTLILKLNAWPTAKLFFAIKIRIEAKLSIKAQPWPQCKGLFLQTKEIIKIKLNKFMISIVRQTLFFATTELR